MAWSFARRVSWFALASAAGLAPACGDDSETSDTSGAQTSSSTSSSASTTATSAGPGPGSGGDDAGSGTGAGSGSGGSGGGEGGEGGEGGGADTHPDAPYGSGDRLRATVLDGGDGAAAFQWFFDTELDASCNVQTGEDGVLRCLPFGGGGGVFADSTCTQVIFIQNEGACSIPK